MPADRVSGWRVTVYDHSVARNSPAGSCVLAQVMGLCDEVEFVVCSDRLDNERPDRVRWIRVPLPARPVFVRYWIFQWLAPLRRRLSGPPRQTREVVQATQGQHIGCDIAYAHFCHRAYLRDQWRKLPARGLRRAARWLNHRYNAWTERRAFRRAKVIVAPSLGLLRELERTYPEIAGRVVHIPNPVDVARFTRPPEFDRADWRRRHGYGDDDVVLVFVALGDFARKGLNVVLDALAACRLAGLRLHVVGGRPGEIEEYRRIAAESAIGAAVQFVGFQSDVRPHLWLADAFVFPSAYEIFPLAVVQAAAAALPVIATSVYGVEEYLRDGRHGWIVARTPVSVAAALRAASQRREALPQMGEAARDAVQQYHVTHFVARWKALLADVMRGGEPVVVQSVAPEAPAG